MLAWEGSLTLEGGSENTKEGKRESTHSFIPRAIGAKPATTVCLNWASFFDPQSIGINVKPSRLDGTSTSQLYMLWMDGVSISRSNETEWDALSDPGQVSKV